MSEPIQMVPRTTKERHAYLEGFIAGMVHVMTVFINASQKVAKELESQQDMLLMDKEMSKDV